MNDQPRMLCYGDILSFEIPVSSQVEDCSYGGFLGYECIKSSANRLLLTENDHRSKIEIAPMGSDGSMPEDFYVNCIFEVAATIGYEAPGEPVNYGSNINLIFRRSGEYLSSDKNKNVANFVSKDQFLNDQNKECSFRVKPKYNIRSEGERVLYHDLIILSDCYGRDMYGFRMDKITFSSNSKESTAFRLVPFVPYAVDSSKSLKGGDIIQLFHKEESALLSVHLDYKNPTAPYPEMETLLEVHANAKDGSMDCGGYWLVENVLEEKFPSSGKKTIGVVSNSSGIRLRHILYDKYMTVVGDVLTLTDDRTNNTVFELRILSDPRGRSSQQLGPTTSLSNDSAVRLYHRKSGKHVVIEFDRNFAPQFCTNDSDYDKDVYQIMITHPYDIDRIFLGKNLKIALENTMRRFIQQNVSKGEKLSSMKKAVTLVRGASENTGLLTDFDPDGDGPMQSRFRFCQNVAKDLCFVPLLLWIAHVTFIRSKQGKQELHPLEDELAEATYGMLGHMLLQSNKTIAQAIIEYGGVAQMLVHLTRARKRTSRHWAPPLLQMVEASYEQTADSKEQLPIVTEQNIKFLIDQVHNLLAKGKVPNKFAYQFLSQICRPDGSSNFNRSRDGRVVINKQVQEMICEQLLGMPNDTDDPDHNPFWSIMVYRTFLDENPGTTPLASARDRDPQDPAARRLPKQQLLISTTPYGQVRPCRVYGQYIPVRPPGEKWKQHEWIDAMKLRNRQSLLVMDPDELKFHHQNDQQCDPEERKKLTSIIEKTMVLTEWKPIEQLDEIQREFYCASLDLIAAICCGRNMWTQMVVRRLIPVDHILAALDSMDRNAKGHITGPYMKEDPMIAVRSSMLNLLFNVYIDSAMLSPMPFNGTDKMIKYSAREDSDSDNEDDNEVHASSSKRERVKRGAPSTPVALDSWDDVFVDECYGKIFSLVSQEDDHLISVSKDMNSEDINICLKYLSNSPVYRKLNNAHFGSNSTFDTNIDNLLQLPNITMTQPLMDFLKFQQGQQRVNLVKRNVRSLKQRAELSEIIMNFMRYQASELWEEEIELPILEYSSSPDAASSYLYTGELPKAKSNDRFGGKHAARNAASSFRKPATDAAVFRPTVRTPSSRTNSTVSASNPLYKAVAGIRSKLEFMSRMLTVVRGTLLRRFFDVDYNQIPHCVGGSPLDKLEKAIRGEGDNNNEKRPLSSEEKKKARRPLPFYDVGAPRGYRVVEKITITGRTVQVLERYPDEFEEEAQLRYASTLSGKAHHISPSKASKITTPKGASVMPSFAQGVPAYDVTETDMDPLREIIITMVSIVSCLPGLEVDPKQFIDANEQHLEDYFKRQFGYITDHFGLVTQMINVKLACVRILTLCLELIHSRTTQALWAIFIPIYDTFKERKLKSYVKFEKRQSGKIEASGRGSAPTKLPSTNTLSVTAKASGIAKTFVDSSLYFEASKKALNLTPSEQSEFRAVTDDALKAHLSLRSDMIWSIDEMFSTHAHEALMRLVYQNNFVLRAESLNLLFRTNSARAELGAGILKEFNENTADDRSAINYLSRQKSVLQQVLCRFRIVPVIFRESGDGFDWGNDPDDTASGVATQYSTATPGKKGNKGGSTPNKIHRPSKSSIEMYLRQKELAQLIARIDLFKLKNVLLNSDMAETMGVINFCFADRDHFATTPDQDMVNQDTSTPTAAAAAAASEEQKDDGGTPGNAAKKSSGKEMMLKMAAAMRDEAKQHALPTAYLINASSSSNDILRLPPHKTNQKMLLESDLHDVVCEFLNANFQTLVSNIEKSEEKMSKLLTEGKDELDSDSDSENGLDKAIRLKQAKAAMDQDVSLLQEQHLEVFRYCFIFLRAFLCQNQQNAQIIGTHTMVALLLHTRHCCEEALGLLNDLIVYNPGVLALITDDEFVTLVKDVELVVSNIYDPDPAFKYSRFGLNMKRCKASLSLIRTIISSTNNGGRMHRFLSMLSHKDENNVSLIEKIVYTGIGSGETSMTNETLLTIGCDTKTMCRLYYIDTERVAFSRMPEHILADPKVTDALFSKMKDAFQEWKPLSEDTSQLYLHLNIISVLGWCSQIDREMERFCSMYLANPKLVLQILQIDKIEIRRAYLPLLQGIWFNGTEFHMEFISPEYHQDMLAIFYSFAQDIRIYHRMTQLKPNDPALKNEYFQISLTRLQSYVFEALLPFLAVMLKTTFMQEFDDFQDDDDMFVTVAPDPSKAKAKAKQQQVAASKQSPSKPLLNKSPPSLVEHVQEILILLSKLSLSNYATTVLTPPGVIPAIQAVLTKEKVIMAHAAQCPNLKALSRSDLNIIKNAILALDRKQNELNQLDKNFSKNVWQLPDGVKAEIVKANCIREFIPVVDTFEVQHGYNMPHLKHVKENRTIYVDGVEEPISPTDENAIAYMYDSTDVILDPLNSRAFRYTVDEMSKFILHYCQYTFPDRYSTLIDQMLLHADEWSHFEEFLTFVEEDYVMQKLHHNPLLKFTGGISSIAHKSAQMMASVVDTVERSSAGGDKLLKHRRRRGRKLISMREYSPFMKWSKNGGLFLELIFDHITYSLGCCQTTNSFRGCSFTANDICKCNNYWMDVLTKGLLTSRLQEMYQIFADQSETELLLLNLEKMRLNLMQDTFAKLNACDLIVRQLSVPPDKLKVSLSSESITLIQKMSINLGVTLLEDGNTLLQNLMIDTVQEEYEALLLNGITRHFLTSIRVQLQAYADVLGTKNGVTIYNVSEVGRLMRLLSLLCEGHNKRAQLFLYDYGVVTEVASFCYEMNMLLSDEMELLLGEETYPLHIKDFPVVFGQRRSPIKWTRDIEGETEEYKAAMNLTRIKLLSELVHTILEALSEFSQGPCYENQLAIARAGATRDMARFFSFFGSFHMVSKAQPLGPQHAQWHSRYKAGVQYIATHEGLMEMKSSPDGAPYWYGNDPVSVDMMIDFHNMKDKYRRDEGGLLDIFDGFDQSSCMSCISSILPSESKVFREYTKKMAKRTKQFSFEANKLAQAAKKFIVEDDAKVGPEDDHDFQGGTINDWIKQKKAYVEAVENEESPPPGNVYLRIQELSTSLVNLEIACLKFCSSLLEGSNMDEEDEVPRNVTQHVDADNLMMNMSNYWQLFLNFNPLDEEQQVEDCFQRKLSYAYYQLVMRICDLAHVAGDLPEKVTKWKIMDKIPIEEHIARVELRGQESATAIAIVYFPIPTLIKKYWNRGDIIAIRDDIVFPADSAGRDSAEEKVKSFMREGRNLIVTLRHLEKLDEVYAPKNLFFKFMVFVGHNFNRLSMLTFLLSLLINILLIESIRDDPHNRDDGFVFSDDNAAENVQWTGFSIRPIYRPLINRLGWLTLASSIATMISYSIMYGWLTVNVGFRENPECMTEINGYFPTRIALFLNRLHIFGCKRAIVNGNSLKVKRWKFTLSLKYYIENKTTTYYSFLVVVVCLGKFLNELWFCLCLVEMLRMSKLMQYVSKAFTANIDQVIASCALAVILLYLFTVVSYSSPQLHNKYYFDNHGEFEDCTTLSTCFRYHLDFGALQSVSWKVGNHIGTAWGQIFNFLFTFTMQIVIPGLVSGIIIDTFSEMRSNKMAIEEDVANTCFICNIDREDFETANVPFGDHIKNDHNMWKYLWYMIYLEKKDRTEFDGVEQYCFSIISGDDPTNIKWLPVKIAKALSKMRDKYDLYTIFQKVTTLQNSLEQLDGKLQANLQQQERSIREVVRAEGIEQSLKMKEDLNSMKRGILKKFSGGATTTPKSAIKIQRSESQDTLDLPRGSAGAAGTLAQIEEDEPLTSLGLDDIFIDQSESKVN